MGEGIEQWRVTIGQWLAGRPMKCVTKVSCKQADGSLRTEKHTEVTTLIICTNN